MTDEQTTSVALRLPKRWLREADALGASMIVPTKRPAVLRQAVKLGLALMKKKQGGKDR